MAYYIIKNTKIYHKTSRNNNQFINVIGYRINFHKSIAFPCSSNKHTKKEIMDTFPFIIVSKKIKYSGVGLTRKVKEPYGENFNLCRKR